MKKVISLLFVVLDLVGLILIGRHQVRPILYTPHEVTIQDQASVVAFQAITVNSMNSESLLWG